MPELNYKEVKTIGVISEKKGWAKKLKLISWNGRPAKYDIRDWSTTDEGTMSKGITLTREELTTLADLIKDALEGEE